MAAILLDKLNKLVSKTIEFAGSMFTLNKVEYDENKIIYTLHTSFGKKSYTKDEIKDFLQNAIQVLPDELIRREKNNQSLIQQGEALAQFIEQENADLGFVNAHLKDMIYKLNNADIIPPELLDKYKLALQAGATVVASSKVKLDALKTVLDVAAKNRAQLGEGDK